MTALSHITECGLRGIHRIPYGMHACHFYAGRAQLIEALVPYFAAGLRNNERCLWVTASPLPAAEAMRALEAAWPGGRDAVGTGALRIIDHEEWYTRARLSTGAVAKAWLDEEQRTLAEGYSGLRVTGNTSFLHAGDWPAFMDYERSVSAGLPGRRIVALCSYALANCSAQQVAEVMSTHDCAFERADAGWQVSPQRF